MNSSRYRQLIVFRAIAAAGSISTAADRLQISTSSVSKSLKQLEHYVGLPLFNRNTRHIELTEAGQQLLHDTSDAIRGLESAMEGVRDLQESPSGTVRLTVARFAYRSVLQPYYAEFCARYPHIQLDISLNDGPEPIPLLAEGYDLGISLGDQIDAGMVARQISGPVSEGLYASHSYVERHGLPDGPQDLSKHHLISYRTSTTRRIFPLILDDHGQSMNIDIPANITTNDVEVMLDSVRQGLGIGRMLVPFYETLHDRQQLVPVLQRYWRNYPPLYLYYLQNSQKAKRIKVFVDFLLEKTHQDQYTPRN